MIFFNHLLSQSTWRYNLQSNKNAWESFLQQIFLFIIESGNNMQECVCEHMDACVCAFLCVCVCVLEREREQGRQRYEQVDV